MKCPQCAGRSLDQRVGPDGIIVDLCAACTGVWMDKGEINHYVKDPERLYHDFVNAYRDTRPGERLCPRCSVKMQQAQFPKPGPLIDVCPKCGGNWFDAGEVQAVQAMLDRELGAEAAAHPTRPPPAEASPSASPPLSRAAGAALIALPSLALRSGIVLLSLYGILLGFCAVAVLCLRLPIEFVFIGAALSLLLAFVITPFLTDLSMTTLHKFHWADPEDLPGGLRRFINEVCRARGIPFPRVGILEDGNPNAFTYGHYPGNARLVLTQGVIDILDEKELDAVVGHEIGHIAHWDMLLMTVAAFVPMILYSIYKACLRFEKRPSSSSSKDKDAVYSIFIGLTALILYYITEYVVLFLSRTRELYADRFSGEITGDPNSLASALVKVAYGLAGRRQDPEETEPSAHATPRALGLFDPVGAAALVASTLTRSGQPSKESILGAMQWDLWNPWAQYYELLSTHPLPARRMELLGRQAAAYGQVPFVNFDLKKPENYWEQFFEDLLVLWLPEILAATSLAVALHEGMSGLRVLYDVASGLGLGFLCQVWFSYRAAFYPEMTVAALLKRIKVSRVRGIPVLLKGKIIGRGVPGYILSEDVVLQDETGFIFLDYLQPLAIFQWIFAISRVPSLIGREVTVCGWYRRGPSPYLEVRTLVCDGRASTCYRLEGSCVFAALLFVAGALGMMGFF